MIKRKNNDGGNKMTKKQYNKLLEKKERIAEKNINNGNWTVKTAIMYQMYHNMNGLLIPMIELEKEEKHQ
jgi:hypothetical protein